jgi:putative tricarboxylic transport membrane protein
MLAILHAAFHGLIQLFALKAFTLQLMGIVIGFIIGILPAIGGPVALALMLPFIFTMSAVEAFSFLLGMAAVNASTGDITSILFGVPGEAITASIILDGHPMAKKGEAGRALGAALMSSFVGAIFGAICLAISIPIVAPLVLSVGSPQYFMFAIAGVAFLGSLTGGSVVKGLASAALGLLLATVGLDPTSGIPRYTFGTLYLWDGIRLVPATLGLFAFPEIIDMAIAGVSIARVDVGKLGGVMQGVKDTFRHWKLVLRCSAIGAYIGLLPGMGAAISQWVSYAHAVQSSPNKERFGKGAVEGVLGASSANHSTLGGALIPTVAFGVPGSVSTAILLGAFLIQGLVPGPPMLLPASRGGHLALTFSFIWIIVVSNIIMTGFCFLFLDKIARITRMRTSLLVPFIVLLVYIGAYVENQSFGDIAVMLVIGVLGWLMVQMDWPRPPMILGLVLGGLAESNLFLSIENYGTDWLRFPSVMILFALIVLGTFYPVFEKLWKKGKPGYQEFAHAVQPQGKEGSQVLGWGVIFSLFVAVWFAWALWEAWDWSFRPGLFPWVVGFLGVPLAVLQLGIDVRGFVKTIGQGLVKMRDEESRRLMRETRKIFAWIFGSFVAIWLLGFSAAVPIITFAYLKAANERWRITLVLTFCAWFCFYGLFIYLLHVPFAQGLLFEWLNA